MTGPKSEQKDILASIRGPLFLTRAGMVCERIVRGFWPLWSVLILTLGLLMLGVQDLVPFWLAAGFLGLAAFVALWSLERGIRAFRWPSEAGALLRLDATLPGSPIQAVLDDQAIGTQDAASSALWRAHQERMRRKLAEARAVEPDLRVSKSDPFALRYFALLVLLTALLFGSVLRVQSVTALGGTGISQATGPTWEGWMEPPSYTGLPTVYLNDIDGPMLAAPYGSKLTVRFYGEPGALGLSETVSGNPLPNDPENPATAFDLTVAQSGQVAVVGENGRIWDVVMQGDAKPAVSRAGDFEATYEGEASLPFTAADDYGVVAGVARIELALGDVDRRYGLRIDPEPQPALEIPLPMPIAGSRDEFTETLIENYSKHPWANLPVTVSLSVEDAARQVGFAEPEVLKLPGRRFFDPLAGAIIEQRQALLWNRENAKMIAQILRAVSNDPKDVFRDDAQYDILKTILERVEGYRTASLSDEMVTELAEDMWNLALILEEGDLEDARERLERAQDRLAEAMKNGASEQEIAELMQELREATDDYMRQLARRNQQESEQNPDSQQSQNQEGMEMSQNDLQAMMDRIQELMEQGRMAEAQQALEELRQMMENMQVTEGQGQGQQSPGEQAMDDLAETLREQQELSDQAFRDLQEQFNPGQQNQGQQGQQGQQQPGQGQSGQQNDGRGEDQQGQGQGEGDQEGQEGQGGQQSMEETLAERQRALRNELGRQQRNLPGEGTEAGEAARDALERAERSMEGAEDALRENDLAEAIDQQSDAMEALREGMRNLGEAMAQEQGQQGQPGQQGTAQGTEPGSQRDPLGRDSGSNGEVGTEESLLQGEDVYRRAQELLDEIRRRTGEAERPEIEREYLERLLDRF